MPQPSPQGPVPPTYLPLGTTPIPPSLRPRDPRQNTGSPPVVMETYISARRYERLSEVVELLFPPVARGPSTDLAHPEYSNFCYWREPLAPVDLSALA